MNFDPVARWYCWLERLTFGGALQRCRTALLHHTTTATHVLILGEGDGRFLEAFLRINSTANVTVVDSSGKMLRLASARVGKVARVSFVQADIREIKLPDEGYDLIVTSFFLDCFPASRIEAIVNQVSVKLAHPGLWLWSDFAIPESGIRRRSARWLVGFLYWFFRRTTRVEAKKLVDPGAIFRTAGFDVSGQTSLCGGLLKSVLWRKSTRMCNAETVDRAT